jgi:N-acetylmuramoyl-L-alanine amidase
MSKWKKVILTLVGLVVACTTIGVMTGNAVAAPPVIVLDPGHSGTSVTTIDPETHIMDKEYPNTPEMEDVFAVATILKAKLEAAGYTVLMTKQAYTDTVTKRQRIDLANNNRAALAVSIHTGGSTFGNWGQIYVQRLDGYRADICGNKVYFNLPAITSLSQQYGQIFLAERRRIEGDSIVVTVDSFDSRDLAPGNLPIVQLWSTVLWIYCEAGALQSDNDQELYAQSLYNSIVACVPITGATPPPVPAEPTFRYEETAPSLVWTGAWTVSSMASASGGSFSYANASGASATIPFTGTRLAWIASTGPVYGLATITVDGVRTYTVDLYSAGTVYTKMVWNTGALPSGSHRVKIAWTGAKNPSAWGTYLSLDALEVAGGLNGVRYEHTDDHIVKVGTWYDFPKTLASGGSYGRSNFANASATIYFTGTRLDWIATKGTTTGLADVYVDDVKVTATPVNLAAASVTYQVNVWSTGTLANGAHRVKIVRSVSSASGKYLTLDAVDVYGTMSQPPVTQTHYEQSNTTIKKTGTWYTYSTTEASGGSYGRSSTSGASTTIKFVGTRLDWIAMKGTTTGYADVYVDNLKVTPTPINLYSATATYRVDVFSTGTLTFGAHTVKIVRSASSATGKYLTLDAVDIWGWITI